MRVGDNIEEISAQITLDATGDKLTFRTSTPIRIVRFGVNVSIALVGTNGRLYIDRTTHIADGTASRADQIGGRSCDIAASNVGSVFYAEPDEEVILKPGDIVFLALDTAIGTSGDGFAWIQYQKLNWDIDSPNADFADAVATNRMTDGGADV